MPCHDVGNPADVHPKGKEPVGQRLALAARKHAYGETQLVASGPVFREAKAEGANMRVTFTETGSGLTIGQAPWRADGDTPWPTDKLVGFTLVGEDQEWHGAEAKIEGDTVIVSSSAVAKPIAVRYAWANFSALQPLLTRSPPRRPLPQRRLADAEEEVIH